MDQVIHRVLRFERFALDLTRGSLRIGEQDIDLRPKAFDVLRHLAENAGRLVSKRELFEAVWPDVTVTDDSLVQCIRELREELGDDEHRLIKTVPRRGYLLDAALTAPPLVPEPLPASGEPPVRMQTIVAERDLAGIAPHGYAQQWRLIGAVAIGIVAVALFGAYFSGLPASVMHTNYPNSVKPAASHAGATFKDCDTCSEMVELPAGEFLMGSPESEIERDGSEGPQRRVTLKQRIAIGKFEITIDQFAAFVEETGFGFRAKCRFFVRGGELSEWPYMKASFREPGFPVSGRHPTVCVNWHDAKAYTGWLAKKTARPYRLPTEAEWEYAARAGTTSTFNFGEDPAKLCDFARFADEDLSLPWRSSCHSTIKEQGALRVGALAPNPWGLFDMHGNAWEWTEDCWTPDARLMPADGSAYRQTDCGWRTVRGGGWNSARKRVRSASRVGQPADMLYYHLGFRVALSLD